MWKKQWVANRKGTLFTNCVIAYKKSREAHYWLQLMIASETVPMERISDLILEGGSLIRILGKIISII
jgi:hypothetical protein